MGPDAQDGQAERGEALPEGLEEGGPAGAEPADLDVGHEEADERLEVPGVHGEGVAGHELSDLLDRLESIDPCLEVHGRHGRQPACSPPEAG